MSHLSVDGARPRPKSSRVRRAVAVLAATLVALPAAVLAGAAPASAAIQTIAFEAPHNQRVVLGDLASRSQGKPVAISGIGPYTVRGTDSLSQQPYEFVTDYNYSPSTSAWGRESDERALTNAGTWTSNTNASFGGRSGVMQLTSRAQCASTSASGTATYCSTFGPDVYTAPFEARVGQAVSFDWAAQKLDDDYEIYAYLVKVDGNGYGTAADHTLLTYGRGDTQGWTTTSREIPADGTYRFRFVNGSYDKTGGLALGSNMFIDSVVRLGAANPIDFPALSDRIVGDAPFSVSATAPGGAVSFASSTPKICSVSNGTVTLTGTVGTCTVVADQSGDQSAYVPAETVARSFRVLAAPTAPTNAGVPFVTGKVAEGETITADEGTWTDGGSAITGTSFQWVSTVGGTPTSLPGETAASCFLIAAPGSQLTVVVTKTNGVGSTSATSTVLNGYTCGQPEAPKWPTAQGLGSAEVGSPVETAFVATGTLAPTYSVSAGALPAGLTLNAATGTVSGTPTTAGAYAFTLRATNASGSADLEVNGVVNAGPGPITGAPSAFVVGEPAAGSLSATGTPAPGYLVTAGALPAGVTLDPDTGAFSGTPTSSGAFAFTVTASNGIGQDTTREFTGTVGQAPGWETQQGLYAEVGVPVDTTFTAVGTPAPQYTIGDGALPPGLVLDADTGRITGTPTEAGPYSFTLVATSELGSSSLPVQGTVVQGPGAISGAPDAWIVGEPATGTVNATGTPAPVYTVTEGTLPDGVTLDPATGAFTGVPAVAGPYSFTVTAENGVGTPSTQEFSGVVDQAPIWNTSDGLALEVGASIETAFTATGTPAPTYAVVEGELPAGLTLDPATGALTGTPTEAGPYSFTLAASNGIGDPALLQVSGVVLAAPQWWDTTIAVPRVGAAFSDGVAAHGTPSATYTVTAGHLPKGLSLDAATGAITGTPTAAGAYSFTVTADNGVGAPATHEFTGTVVQSPVVGKTPKLPTLVVGTPVSVDLSRGVQATPAPTFRVSAGELPAGLTLDETTGLLSGAPTAPGAYSFTITVDNGTGETLTFEFSGVVEATAAGSGDGPATDTGNQGGGLAATGSELPHAALLIGALLVLAGLAMRLRARRIR